jgi:DNA topoisomerase-1
MVLQDARMDKSPLDEAVFFAEEAGLRYVRDDSPGIRRRRSGKGFIYFAPDGSRIRDGNVLARIKSLVIPPAWEKVWICRSSNGHIQATGRDARNRKQYIYHSKWKEARNETKFSKLCSFGECLPEIRKRLEQDLRKPGMPREKVLAAVVKTMEITRIRIGNDAYAEENHSFGLTTIRNGHAKVKGAKIKFKFRGKSGVVHEVSFQDRRLSKIIRRCQELPGEELFGYEDESGQTHDVTSGDVNEYLQAISGQAITAKDIRTWGGTVKAVKELGLLGPVGKKFSDTARKRRHNQILKEVAAHLGNTVTVCRKYYVHPAIFETDCDGRLHKLWRKFTSVREQSIYELEERVTLAMLSA